MTLTKKKSCSFMPIRTLSAKNLLLIDIGWLLTVNAVGRTVGPHTELFNSTEANNQCMGMSDLECCLFTEKR